MKTLLIPCAFMLLFFAACEKTADVVPEVLPPNAQTPVNTGLNADLLLKLVNDVRTKGCTCGEINMPAVSPLSLNNLLSAAALSHSKDMNTNGYFSHTSLDGRTPGSRITSAGYKWVTYGENIAMGQPNEQTVFDAWIKSEGHCKNIMNANFKEMGAGKDGKYWTQVFGKQ